MLIVISAPSGTGKTTIAHRIMALFPQLRFSVSATTRPIRPGEEDGHDYFFLTREDFQRRVAEGDLVEWEEIYGNLYGTLKSEVDRCLRQGGSLLFDIDVKGALNIKRVYGEQAVLIFIRPPDMDVLRSRLEHRGTDSADVIRVRLERAEWEIEQAVHFDREVINDDLSRSVPAVADIVTDTLKSGQRK